jgi:hypothetical protein
MMHPRFGLCHVRLQTWVPFTATACLNGREWLARQLDSAGIAYDKRDNCFPWISDVAAAQSLADSQQKIPWRETLDQLLDTVFPSRRQFFPEKECAYYWSVEQSEWATDIMFRRQGDLDRLYPALINYATAGLGSRDVLRFLGRLNPGHALSPRATMEVTTDLKHRPEGVRVKHRAGNNSVKLYNKQATVLRAETTVNDIREFREKRPDPNGGKRPVWRRMRKSVVTISRRAEISHGVNERYLDALSHARSDERIGEVIASVSRRLLHKGRPYRALNLWHQQDSTLLKIIASGQFIAHGFRNRDLRIRLYGSGADEQQQHRQAATITRKLALLRAHRLIRKIPGENKYHVTSRGRSLSTALLQVNQLTMQQITEIAA